ncbi:transketolase family protein, partial [Candidatus Woesearchaeota archaeon]|nr:transketolase family protein [Candidatus Woesearchaeota archaeon]
MGINPKAYLIDALYAKDVKRVNTRDGYGKGLVKAGEKNPNVVVLCADLTESTRSQWFKERFPSRFIE